MFCCSFLLNLPAGGGDCGNCGGNQSCIISGRSSGGLFGSFGGFGSSFGGLLALEWGAYLLLDFFYSYNIAKEKGLKFLPVEIILYPAFHFAYGYGSLVGITQLPKFLKAEKAKKEAERQKGKQA